MIPLLVSVIGITVALSAGYVLYQAIRAWWSRRMVEAVNKDMKDASNRDSIG